MNYFSGLFREYDSKMVKQYCLLISMFILIFLLIPSSFALEDNNLTEINGNNIDVNYLGDSSEIHVDIKGSDDNDGGVNSPVATIDKAISLSDANSKIIIHEGVYKENNLNITKSLEVHGQGNVVIDAEGLSRIFTINTPTTSDTVLLSGITFINGQAYQGGAIYIRGAVTTIDNSRFINNTVSAQGGAIYWNSENGKLINSLIENNSARDGAGVCWGESETDFSIGGGDYGQVLNCTFNNNKLQQDDDACIGLSVYSNHMKVLNSKFINHETNYNSSFGVLYINGDYGTVEGCLFKDNALTLTGAIGLDGNYAIACGNTFINNTVSSPDCFGGAIGIQSETGNIYNNTFISNGGEQCLGGAIFINMMESHQFSFINITDNYFKDNTGLYGGVVYCYGQNYMLTLIIRNNVFDSNRADTGGVIYLKDIYDPVIITNNTFKNTVSNSTSGIYFHNCILDLSRNIMENCSSSDCDIYAYGEIRTPVYLKFNDITAILGKSTNLTAVLTDDEGNTILTKDITFKVDDVELNGKKGLNMVTATFNELGTYIISGEYRYGAFNVENATLKVVNGAFLNVSNVDVWCNEVEINLDVYDSFNNPISNAYVFINLKGNDVLLLTDSSGHAKTTTNLDFGQYNLTARFENKNYLPVEKEFTVNVFSSINASSLTRAQNSESDFYAQLFNKDGSLLSNSNVIFEVNGIEYNVTADSNGLANLNTKLSPGQYNVIVKNLVTGQQASYTLSIVKRITGNSNINMYFGAGSTYKIRVFLDNGSVAGENEIVKININKKSQNIKTDKNGYASFKITLNPGTYTLTATYNGVKVSNKIVVKPVLSAKNISKKKAKTIKFTAKLVNTKGKVLKGKKITFKVKGKTYKATTNKKGIATVSLKNLKVGKYTITTKYGKSSIKNTITVKR